MKIRSPWDDIDAVVLPLVWTFRAKYKGKCAICGDEFPKGEVISDRACEHYSYSHKQCAEDHARAYAACRAK